MMIWITLMEPLWFHCGSIPPSRIQAVFRLRQMPPVTDVCGNGEPENTQVMSTHAKRINKATFLTNIGNVMWGLVIFSIIQLILIIFKYWRTGPKWCPEEKPQRIGAGREQINTRNVTILVAYLPELVFIWHLKKGRSKERTETLQVEHTINVYCI